MNPRAIIVMGVSGCGKSSLSQALAARFEGAGVPVRLLEGDEFHPPENVEKMRTGTPLNDADREPWLRALNAAMRDSVAQGNTTLLACSALKEKYRDMLAAGLPSVRFVHPAGTFEVIEARMKKRSHKYMPPSLLKSQFETLEAPRDAITLDVAYTIEELADQAFALLKAEAPV